ncbi:MAG: dephospho-CoA kinase [Ilumatobacter coccineus]|uniref:Dephospho-CoA kinase n=1 Tax=Ilumatobacter coccineus TaxID=467094 RepID=A0A2G6K895_9ACTN|nr:MAG: dephospho-CoA kinase [Ilumatobacter coccineus]
MLLVGVTGGIGSGKSTVAALLAERGAIVVDADQVARELQSPGSDMVLALAERFGPEIVMPDGALDRAAVAALVFGDSDEARANLAELNAITHPAIRDEIIRRIAAHDDHDGVVILDHPLLAEPSGASLRDGLAGVVVVDVPTEIAVQRLVSSRSMDENDARRRIASQVSRNERLAYATHVIDNGGDLDDLRRQVDELWVELTMMDGV